MMTTSEVPNTLQSKKIYGRNWQFQFYSEFISILKPGKTGKAKYIPSYEIMIDLFDLYNDEHIDK